MSIEFTARFERIPAYPAASSYEYEGELVKLASNENPWPPHPDVFDAVSARLRGLNLYPDPHNSLLRRRLAERYELGAERIAVGNGSCEILLAAAEAMLEPGAEIVYGWPAFSMYPHLDAMTGARPIAVPLDDQDTHDLDAMAREITAATRICVICNPNNPTATAVSVDELESFAQELPRHVCVIVDEAYIEFSTLADPDESLRLLDAHPNVVLLRTFSKIYGLAGLRVGYALGSERFRHGVDRVRQPFSVNALAEAAAAEALLHQDDVASRAERTAVERLHVESALAERGVSSTDSQANFSWVDLGERDEGQVLEALARQGVLVRGGAGLGREGFIRVTYGTRPQNERFLAALDHALAADR